MNASFEWLHAFVPSPHTPAQLRDLITARTATVDEIIALRSDLAGVVIGRVVEAGRHPNSDHLWVTKVDAGSGELLDVVCGAPNVQAGKLYPFAPVGTVLPGGLKLERRKIRGETSNGMLCSARELGLGQDHDGIMELSLEAAPGTPFLQAMSVGDTRIVIDVLPNRPDLLSHIGVAREIAAATGLSLRHPAEGAHSEEYPVGGHPDTQALEHSLFPEGDRAPSLEAQSGTVRVTLEDPTGSPRFLGASIRNVRVGPSPRWLVERIEAIGGRSINNVVDVTNYMLHGYGQPMHAYDAKKLAGSRIIVRRARAGETLTTLDGVTRTLRDDMLVIADGERAQGVAGVMGGRDSEVDEHTTDVFLEAATFEPSSVRATRRALGISTDASYRFERGVAAQSPRLWLAEAVRLIIAVAGGTADGHAADVRVPLPEPESRTLRPSRVARVLGEPVDSATITNLLSSIGFLVDAQSDDALAVTSPWWRQDIVREVDLIEEVARLRGYDSFSDELRPYRTGTVPDAPMAVLARELRETAVGLGLLETRAMPFVKGGSEGFVRVTNPLAENEAYLRTAVLESLARRAEHNLAHMQGNVRLFEIGAAFQPRQGALPHEEMRIAALVMGDRRPAHFTEPKPPAFDEWDAKAIAERIAAVAFGDGAAKLVPAEDTTSGVLWNVLHPTGGAIGVVRRVALDAPVWAAPAFGVELTLSVVDSAPVAAPGEHAHAEASESAPPARALRYTPLPVTPAAEFDLALVVPNDMPAERVHALIIESSGELLERLQLFDEFRGAGVPEGTRSLAWRLTFRHPERTLRDKELEGRRSKLLRTLEAELGVKQRSV